MDNDQIRFSILCQYHRARFNGESEPPNLNLEGVDEITKEANLVYLVDKKLINGVKHHSTDGTVSVITYDISYRGIDVIESIMEESLDKLEPSIRNEIKEERGNDKMVKLYEKIAESASVCDVVMKVAKAAFAALGNAGEGDPQ